MTQTSPSKSATIPLNVLMRGETVEATPHRWLIGVRLIDRTGGTLDDTRPVASFDRHRLTAPIGFLPRFFASVIGSESSPSSSEAVRGFYLYEPARELRPFRPVRAEGTKLRRPRQGRAWRYGHAPWRRQGCSARSLETSVV